MASALGMGKKPSPEEIRERQGQVSKAGESGDTMKVRAGSATGSGLYDVDPRFDTTGKISVNKAGQKEFWVDANEGYRWDPVRQRYKAIDGYGRGYVYLDPVQQEAAVDGGNSGKGKGGSAKPSAPANKPGYIEERAGSPGLTTEQMMGNTYNQMMDWRPTASNGAGGVQGMNPLVDPNKFLYQADPAQQQTRAIGRYVNPNIQPQGLLVATPNFKKSQNPYSLLG